MNVTMDAMRPASAPRALWWFTLLFVVVGGLVMRCLTIDRNTPGIGSVVYVAMLAVLFIAIACPVGAGVAFLVHWTADWKHGARLRKHGAWWVVAVAALLTIAFFCAGRRLPAWHVWMSAVMFTVLVAHRIFEGALSLFAQTRCEKSTDFLGVLDPREASADKPARPFESKMSGAALVSDDRRIILCWRQYCSIVGNKNMR
jgi:hypothetical protein